MALEMRDECERCGTATPPDGGAYICSFECTWCPACATGELDGRCPNCGGQLEKRPTRVT